LLADYLLRDIFMKTSIVRTRKNRKKEVMVVCRPIASIHLTLLRPQLSRPEWCKAHEIASGPEGVRKLPELGFATSGETKPLERIRTLLGAGR
jgi:hypothetical protein